jgi:hypothetical protein
VFHVNRTVEEILRDFDPARDLTSSRALNHTWIHPLPRADRSQNPYYFSSRRVNGQKFAGQYRLDMGGDAA